MANDTDYKAMWEKLKASVQVHIKGLRQRIDQENSTPISRGMCMMAESLDKEMYELEYGQLKEVVILSAEELH